MYSVSIPVNCDKFYRCKDKDQILNELRAFDADRVFLNFETALDGHVLLSDETAYRRQIDRMREACLFFRQNGYEVGAWFWGLQFDRGLPFTQIRTLNGKVAEGFACPTDEDLLDAFSRCLRDVALTGVDIILLNDDLRFGAWGGFGCLCENHRRMICRELGEELDAAAIAERILDGGENPWRAAFLRANRLSLEEYAIRMRRAVDEVDPKIRLGFCACMSSWDIDGDAFHLSRLFAGNTRPILRLIGAPYWAVGKGWGNCLQDVIELERMEASWNPYGDIELIAEGDVYPRPRSACAANYLEGFDTALRASGALDGILRICTDYVSNVGYESGYLKQYRKNKPLYEQIQKHFAHKTHVGIRVYESRNKVGVMELPNRLGEESDMENAFFSDAARVLSANAIPTVYEGLGVTGIAFGENAYALTEQSLENGMILDALSAKILSDRGIDVGIKSLGKRMQVRFQYLPEDDNYIIAKGASVFDIQLQEGAQTLSLASRDLDQAGVPFCYRYRNAKGQRFLVFNCIGKQCEAHLKQYANAGLITDSVEWLSGNRLPAFCPGYPNLYMQCKEDADSLSIGLWNFFEDEAIEPILHLGGTYRGAEFIGCTGELLGDTVRLSDIPPYAFFGIVLRK